MSFQRERPSAPSQMESSDELGKIRFFPQTLQVPELVGPFGALITQWWLCARRRDGVALPLPLLAEVLARVRVERSRVLLAVFVAIFPPASLPTLAVSVSL